MDRHGLYATAMTKWGVKARDDLTEPEGGIRGALSLADHDVLSVLIESLSGHDLVAARRSVLEEVHPADLGCGWNGRSEIRILSIDWPVQAVQSDRRSGRKFTLLRRMVVASIRMLDTLRLKVSPSAFKLRAALTVAIESSDPRIDQGNIPCTTNHCLAGHLQTGVLQGQIGPGGQNQVSGGRFQAHPLGKLHLPELITTNRAASSGFEAQEKSPTNPRVSAALKTIVCPAEPAK